MNTAFYSGLSGLSAYSAALNVVGNNLANVNTPGFKFSEVTFEDLVSRTFGGTATNGAGNPMQVGLGILPNSINGVFSQGSIKSTSDATNVALEGNGFFVVGDTATDRFYTRSGDFFLDEDGNLVNSGGKYVLGYTEMDANNNILASGDLNLINLAANTTAGPQESTFMEIFANLDARAAVGDQYSASTTIYDSLGAPHTATATFEYMGLDAAFNPQWNYAITVPIADVNDPATVATSTVYDLVTGDPADSIADVLANGDNITFDGTGIILTPAAAAGQIQLQVDANGWANGADIIAPGDLTWNIFDENGVGIITGYPLPSTTTSTNTDGYPPGSLTSLVVDAAGVVQGVFTNGQVIEQAQLAIAQFNSPKGLLRMGRNLFTESNASGQPALGAADTGGRGVVVGSALEASNVDMAVEFTQMLVFERGYQANSKIISTSDTVTQTALSLVR
ncbi:MAG: flagellar hook protein FlgE [bacterium]|nr:flagellar hook protein FlgE [bacterium]